MRASGSAAAAEPVRARANLRGMTEEKGVPAGNPLPPHPDESLRRDLLLRDFEYSSQSFWKNEELGERRVQFLITLVTAVMAGLGALYGYSVETVRMTGVTAEAAEDAAGHTVGWVAIPALIGLLVIGFVTFLRMVNRDKVTDDYKERSDQIRRVVLGDLVHFWLYEPEELKNVEQGKPPSVPGLGKKLARSWLSGGLAMTVASINGLLAGVLVALGVWFVPGNVDAREAWIPGALAAVLTVAVQVIFMTWRYQRAGARRGAHHDDRHRYASRVRSAGSFTPE